MDINRRAFIEMSSLPLLVGCATTSPKPVIGRIRARELGIRIGYLPTGQWNAITDVAGVEVGHTTLVRGNGPLVTGQGPVRTGVTAIWPNRNIVHQYLPCGVDAPNGNGEMTSMLQARQMGVLTSPLCLTNTSSVGMVYDNLLKLQPRDDLPAGIPLVGETWDGYLNDIVGRHVHSSHVQAALENASSGPVEEGAVGGGTGMVCYEFKGGVGTSSRVVTIGEQVGPYTVGALVQANHGERKLLRIDGVPVGEQIPVQKQAAGDLNSILMIIATDAPLLSHQLSRVARRATHGLAKTGSISGNSSGDFSLAFSTANPIERRAFWKDDSYTMQTVEQFDIDPLLQAASEATEEAIINALCMAVDTVGINDTKVAALPLEKTREIMSQHHRLFTPWPGLSGGAANV
jgi:D-aminopeptidase